jgi:hypothetical protein
MMRGLRLRRRLDIDRDAAFERAFWDAAVVRMPERCPYCDRPIRNPYNLARHVRAKHLSSRPRDDGGLARSA